MYNNTNITSNSSNGFANSILQGIGSFPTVSSTSQPPFKAILPIFKMEIFKSENEGFILNLIKPSDGVHEESKLFILKDVEHFGRDIQNILVTEILKK